MNTALLKVFYPHFCVQDNMITAMQRMNTAVQKAMQDKMISLTEVMNMLNQWSM